MTPLWEATRDLHHACEEHPVGAAMATGDPPRQWYADWLMALAQIHSELDNCLPKEVHRASRLYDDINDIDLPANFSEVADKYVASLDTPQKIAGAAYVLTGAHLMGGEVMRRRLVNFPTKHLSWENRKAALAVLQIYRTREDIITEARNCFQALLDIMNEIQRRS